MMTSIELPDCFYQNDKPTLISPNAPTPNHSLYLSNLDDQKFLRFSIRYLYLFQKAVSSEILKTSLSKALVYYYPLAGRLRTSTTNTAQDDQKLEIDCNGKGAFFAEAFMDITAQEFLQFSNKPNKSWRKLLYKVETSTFLDVPPLVVQVTNLRCGGMILCTAINHCVCDGIGTSQFLQAWAHMTTKPYLDLPISPVHIRHLLKPRDPPQVMFTHPQYIRSKETNDHVDLLKDLQSQPLVPISLTFAPSHIVHLKRECVPWLKCTTFEALASHTWRSWIRSLNLSPSMSVKLLFSMNVRKRLIPYIPQGYYGNAFVLGCAQSTVNDLVNSTLHQCVKLVQDAKSALNDEHVRSMIDLLEDKMVKTDLSTSMVISQWAKLGLEDLDFGEGKALHMGPVTSDVYCLFLPVAGDFDAVRVLVSMPESMVEKFEYYMTGYLSTQVHNKDANDNSYHGHDGNGTQT